VDNISDENLLESYMGVLKQAIKHEILLKHLENVMEDMWFSRHIQAKNKDTHMYTMGAYIRSTFFLRFIRQTYLNLVKYHKRKWRKEE